MSNNKKQKKVAPRKSAVMPDIEDISKLLAARGPGTKASKQNFTSGSTDCGSCALKDSCVSQKMVDSKSGNTKTTGSNKSEASQKPGTTDNGEVKSGTLADWPESDKPFFWGPNECQGNSLETLK